MPAGPGKRGLFLHTVVVTGLPYAQSRYREPGKSPKPMMPRPTYNYNQEWEIVLAYDDRGEPVRTIAYRLQILNGRLIRFAVALRIRSDRNEKVRDIVRYDDFRGFHRHAPGFPPSREHDWITVLPGTEFAFIKADLATNADKYEREARASGFEVTEDDEPEADS
jgi:hypothetical protein